MTKNNVSLNCVTKELGLEQYFKITIDKNKDVADLKIAICDKVKDFYNDFYKNTCSYIGEFSIKLWKVDVPSSEERRFEQLKKNNSIVEDVVNGIRIFNSKSKIGDIFSKLNEENIHIVTLGKRSVKFCNFELAVRQC